MHAVLYLRISFSHAPDGSRGVTKGVRLSRKVLAAHPAADERIQSVLEWLQRSESFDFLSAGQKIRQVVDVYGQSAADVRELFQKEGNAIRYRHVPPVFRRLGHLVGHSVRAPQQRKEGRVWVDLDKLVRGAGRRDRCRDGIALSVSVN